MEHPKIEGHVTPNEDENIRNLTQIQILPMEHHNSPLVTSLSLLIMFILAEETDAEVCRFRKFQTSVTLTLTLNRVIRHKVAYSNIDLCLHTKFRWNRKNFRVDGRTYR